VRQKKGGKPSRRPLQLDPSKLPKESDPSLKLVWVDRMELLLRSDVPIATLRFYTVVGTEKLTEACRLQTTVSHLRAIVDLLCRQLDYYPAKPKP
jgi:hypothetical protein